MPVTVQAPPPRKASASVASDGAKSNMSKKARERADGLNGIGQLVSAGFLFARQPADAVTINAHWPNISREGALLAEDNPGLAEQLDRIIAVGPYAGLIEAALPMFLQLAVNHGKVDATAVASLGVVSKETMQARAQVAIMEAEVAAMKLQMDMDRERAETLAEYREMMEAARLETELAESADAMRQGPA